MWKRGTWACDREGDGSGPSVGSDKLSSGAREEKRQEKRRAH